nr:hypothetical protein [Thermoleophilaceae bacterium]
MRRRLSEQPRVVAAQLLVALALVGTGFAIARIAADDDRVPPAATAALDRARSESRQDKLALRDARAAVARLRSELN